MDFSNTRYRKVNRYLLKLVGMWPYQSRAQRLFRSYFMVAFTSLICITQVVKIIERIHDLELVTEAIPPVLTLTGCGTKLLALMANPEKMKLIHDEIDNHWRSLEDEEEIEIVKKYARQGELYSTIYSLYMFGAMTTFILFIFEPRLLDIVIPLNETRPMKTIYPATYFISEEKYFILITCHMTMGIYVVMYQLLASDTTFMIYVQYICAIYAVVGFRLEKGMYKQGYSTEKLVSRRRKLYNRYITDCVRNHRTALRLVEHVESVFSVSQLTILINAIFCISITLLQVVILLGKLEVVRYILYFIGQVIHLLCVCFEGQILINHSDELSKKIYGGSWYNVPNESQKMILFLLKSSSIPTFLTAGKVFIYSLENYSMVLQKCMSYFMVLASFR